MSHCPSCRRETPTLTGHDSDRFATTLEVVTVRTCEVCGTVKSRELGTRTSSEGLRSYPTAKPVAIDDTSAAQEMATVLALASHRRRARAQRLAS